MIVNESSYNFHGYLYFNILIELEQKNQIIYNNKCEKTII